MTFYLNFAQLKQKNMAKKVYMIFDDEKVWSQKLARWNRGLIRDLIKNAKIVQTKRDRIQSTVKSFCGDKKTYIDNLPQNTKNGTVLVGFQTFFSYEKTTFLLLFAHLQHFYKKNLHFTVLPLS